MNHNLHARCRRIVAVSICRSRWAPPLVACAALTGVSTSSPIATPRRRHRRRHTRYDPVDRLSAYGFMNGSQPRLDRLARDSVIFDRALSVAPLTLPAHSSLFTGLFPPAHGVRDNADPPLHAVNETLAELLRARGFRTGAFIGSMVLGADRGLAQGFDHYSVPVEAAAGGGTRPAFQRRADAVVTDAIHWLDGVAGSPFFSLDASLRSAPALRSTGALPVAQRQSVPGRDCVHRRANRQVARRAPAAAAAAADARRGRG